MHKYLIASALLLAGCAGPTDPSSIPRQGNGIAEYREITRHAHRAVADVVDALEPLAPGSGLPRFDRALEQLELTSVKARARAEAIIARGQNYFDEWKEQLAIATNAAAARSQTERYDRLFDHFTRIQQRSAEVRQEFRPFMSSLREFRATLDQPSTSSQREAWSTVIDALTADGRRVLKALEEVSGALNDAEVELRAVRASTR